MLFRSFFRLHLPGIRFNNSNWPRIVKAMRTWTVGMPVLFPVVYWLLRPWWGNLAVNLCVTLVGGVGILIPVIAAGKKYE